MTLDAVTGLYYSRNRNYSPTLGTWISQDPLSYVNGADTYQFVESGPATNADPWGTRSIGHAVGTAIGKTIGGVIGLIGGGAAGGGTGLVVGLPTGPGEAVTVPAGAAIGAAAGAAAGVAIGGKIGGAVGNAVGVAGHAIGSAAATAEAIAAAKAAAAGHAIETGATALGNDLANFFSSGNKPTGGAPAAGKICPKSVFSGIKGSPDYPEGFRPAKNGLTKNPIKNSQLLNELRNIEPGDWQKVYNDGYDSAGNRASIHYFQGPSGKVFNVQVYPGWSNQ